MKLATILVALMSITITSCKDMKDVDGDYEVTTVGSNDYSEYDITISIEMGEENKISGKSACNQYFGSFKNPEKNQIEMGMLAGTKMYCSDLDEIEKDYKNHLSKVASVEVTKTGILLMDKKGKVIIIAVKKEDI
ncbi:META domain-containing protein [Nonlabens sp.]|uniref:META domain-containing protein n=1 Tax=Nonlabens sp. TaxID=1888209 RepID=UPI001BD027E5|nr:META domain-containing protein [Nonlabens sp.]